MNDGAEQKVTHLTGKQNTLALFVLGSNCWATEPEPPFHRNVYSSDGSVGYILTIMAEMVRFSKSGNMFFSHDKSERKCEMWPTNGEDKRMEKYSPILVG